MSSVVVRRLAVQLHCLRLHVLHVVWDEAVLLEKITLSLVNALTQRYIQPKFDIDYKRENMEIVDAQGGFSPSVKIY